MTFTEFGSLLDGAPAHIAFFSTFQFDPDYFERQLLRRRTSLSKARRIVVFMDAREWAALIRQDIHARWLNQRYLVVPVHCSTGVFHPKLSLLLSESGGHVLCGSNNLTRSGCSSNLELLNSVPFDFHNNCEEEMLVAREAFRFFKRAAQDTEDEIGHLVLEWIDETAATFPWLEQSTKQIEAQRTVRLIHSYDGPLRNQLFKHLQSRTVDEFFIISPFHDRKCEIALTFADHWSKAKMCFVVQSGYTNLSVGPLKSLKRVRLHELQNIGSSRRIHAKLVAWKSAIDNGCLVGSANFTSAAFNARNVETCFLIDSTDDLIESLFDKHLSTIPIRFDEFEPGTTEEPNGDDEEPPLLKLLSVILISQTEVRVSFSHKLANNPSSLRLAIRGVGDGRTAISVTLPNRSAGIVTVNLREKAVSEIHGTLLATLIADTTDGRRYSDPLWIIQPHLLTSESGEGSSSTKSRVEESGEGLPEYLDEIGQRDGVVGVVEYLRHLNIRFSDGGKRSGFRKFRIQIRDPFKFDTAPNWLIEAKSESDDLASAVLDFTKRHENRRLRKHAENGNINGIENFLDIMRAMIRLTYVFYRRENVPIKRGHLIAVITRCIELATSGIEDEDDPWDGFLYAMWNSLDGDVETLADVLNETGYTAEIRAILLIAQKVRFIPDEKVPSGKPPTRPQEVLSDWAKMIGIAFSECEIDEPSGEKVEQVLNSYRMFSEDEIGDMLLELPIA